MLNKKIEKVLNDQINAEMYSAYLYLSMSAYFESKNLSGMANWMYVQYQEEMTHAMKFYRYVNDRGGKVTFKEIKAPKTEWKDSVDVFTNVLEHEQYVTSLINSLVDLAIEEKDHATNNMLQWFVAEQVEEEASAEDILEKVKRVIDSRNGLYLIDKELSSRTFIDETKEGE
jgi:ferritin